MYEGDTPNAERRAAALALDRDLLRELLGQEELRELIDPEALAEVERQLRGDPRDPGWGREPEEHWGELSTGDEARRVETVPGAYACFYEGVVGALREDAPPPVDPDQVVAALEVLDAARLAARERRVVRPGSPEAPAGLPTTDGG